MHSDKLEQEIARVVQSVNEWDDRTSPEDYPDHLLITSEELADILRNFAPVAATPVGPEWQTMDTAPKDGSHVLLYCEYYGIGRCVWESWRKVWRSDDPNHGIGFPEPTHWMPLPEFPAGSVRAESARRAALAAICTGDEP